MVNSNLVKALSLLVKGREADLIIGTNHEGFDESLIYLINNWVNDEERIIHNNDAEIHIEKETDGFGFSIMIQKYPRRLWLRWK